MTNYENSLTVIGSEYQTRRFDRAFRRGISEAEKRCHNTPEIPFRFDWTSDNRRFKQYCFRTSSLAVSCVRNLSRRFPALVFNLNFEASREEWGDGHFNKVVEKTGEFTLVNGETACGHFTFDDVKRYPAWDYDPEPEENQTNTKEAA